MLTPAEGARTATRLATAPDLDGVTGLYFVRDTESATPAVSHDTEIQNRLLALSRTRFTR
ncbi:hypothetical protein [Streptomyces goshikiensis]|uniref:hypothetical protein n=1 Tax=Streptomyces goshikiensis TaxID=1942 RepID=UPI0036625566